MAISASRECPETLSLRSFESLGVIFPAPWCDERLSDYTGNLLK